MPSARNVMRGRKRGVVTVVAHVDNGYGGVACCGGFLGCEEGLREGGCREAWEVAYCGHFWELLV
jgi:hypothetical protein